MLALPGASGYDLLGRGSSGGGVERVFGWAVAGVVLVSCASGPKIRPGPPLQAKFAPPPGMHFIIQARQERFSSIVFPKGASTESTIADYAKADETYQTLPRGGYLVTETLLEQGAARDKEPVVSAENALIGVPIKFTIDADGKFIEVVNVEDVINGIKANAIDKTQRKLLEDTLTPESITAPVKQAWQDRFEGICDHELAPGAALYRLDNASVSAPAEIPIRSLMKETVLGSGERGMMPVMELALEYGGETSDLAHTKEGREFLDSLPPGTQMLSPDVKGHGSRIIALRSCQTLEEQSVIEGEIPLQLRLNIPDPAIPKTVRFRITRQVVRTYPAGAM